MGSKIGIINDARRPKIQDIKFDKLKRKLRELFQMDKADLDFGIYRIMNQKRAELDVFIDNDLRSIAQDELKNTTQVKQLTYRKNLTEPSRVPGNLE